MVVTELPAWAWAAIGFLNGAAARQLISVMRGMRRRRAPTVTIPLEGLATVLVSLGKIHDRRAEQMKLKVAVGGKMTREAWATVSIKLLDLIGGTLTEPERRAVHKYLETSRRAWDDLEQQAAAQAPGQDAPPAPTI